MEKYGAMCSSVEREGRGVNDFNLVFVLLAVYLSPQPGKLTAITFYQSAKVYGFCDLF